jgi:HlyD family secretion protein
MNSASSGTVLRSALGLCGAALLIAALAQPIGAQQAKDQQPKNWQAVAPGLVEAKSGSIKIGAVSVGRIADVAVAANDKVVAGEPLVRLDSAEARARVASAQAQVAMHKKDRNGQSAGKAANRRKAEDAVADAEVALIDARDAFDKAAFARRAGTGFETDVTTARNAWTGAEENLNQRRTQLRQVEADPDTPLPTTNEGELNVARADLRVAYVELEKLTLRAPIAGTVLEVNAKAGELAAPTAAQPLVLLGDLSSLRVRAEVDEHDLGKIKLGDKAAVRADAVRGRDFAGKVSFIAPIIEPGRISSSGGRNLTDFSVADVLVDLTDPGPLVVGMKVDVYFGP